MALILIDTNVLVYLYDHNNPSRQSRSKSVLDKLQGVGAGRLSVQSLSEFANIAPKKLSISMTEVMEIIRMLASVFPVCYVTPTMVADALRGVRDYQLPFYDAQIWSCARFNQIPVVFSEDFQDGQIVEGIHFVNPFTEKFVLEKWI